MVTGRINKPKSIEELITQGYDEPLLFDSSETKDLFDFDIDEGWNLKASPSAPGVSPVFSLIDKDKYEYNFDALTNPVDYWAGYTPTGRAEDVYGGKTQLEKETIASQEGGFVTRQPGGLESAWGITPTGRPEDTFGAQTIVQQQNLENLIKELYPDKDLQSFSDFITTTPEAFLEDISTRGLTGQARGLLASLGVSDEDINSIFLQPMGKTPKTFEEIDQDIINRPKEGVLKDFWDTLSVGFKKTFTKDMPDFFQTAKQAMASLPISPNYSPKEFAQIEAQKQVTMQKALQTKAKSDLKWQEWIEKHPKLQPPAGYDKLDPFENPNLWKDPYFYALTIGNVLPASLGALTVGIGTSAVTGGNVWAGIAAGSVFMYPLATQNLYDDLVNSGASPEQASQLSMLIGVPLSALEGVGNLFLLSAVYKPFGGVVSKLTSKIATNTFLRLLDKGITNFASEEAGEVVTEVTQQMIQNWTASLFDENRKVLEGLDVTAIQTLIGTAPLALFGGTMASIRTSDGTTKEVKLTNYYKQRVRELQFDGLNKNEATLAILNEIAAIPEGQQSIADFISRLQGEVTPSQQAQMTARAELAKQEPGQPAKEAWQMTREEYKKIPHFVSQDFMHMKYHQEVVAKALSEGKPVPESVLKDYPDLKVKEPTKGTPVTKEGLPELPAPEVGVPVTPEVTIKQTELPQGWKIEIGKTRTKEGRTAEAEVDWRRKVIVFRDRESRGNPEIVNHEIAHVKFEELPEARKHSLLEQYSKFIPDDEIMWDMSHTLERSMLPEWIAMDYGQYLTDASKLKPEIRAFFDKELPITKLPTPEVVKPLAEIVPTGAEIPVPPLKPPAEAVGKTGDKIANIQSFPKEVLSTYRDKNIGDIAKLKKIVASREEGVSELESTAMSSKELALLESEKTSLETEKAQLTSAESRVSQLSEEIARRETGIKPSPIKPAEAVVKPEAIPEAKAEEVKPVEVKGEGNIRVEVNPVALENHPDVRAIFNKKTNTISFRTAEDMANPELYGHEEAHAYINSLSVSDRQNFLAEYAKVSKLNPYEEIEVTPGHFIGIDELFAMEYAQYKVRPTEMTKVLRGFFVKVETTIQETHAKLPEVTKATEPPPQSVVPPKPPKPPVTAKAKEPSKPVTPAPMQRVIDLSTEQVRQDRPGAITKLFHAIPGIKQLMEFERPGLKMTGKKEKILVSMVAEQAGKADVSVQAFASRMPLLKDIKKVFGNDALRGGQIDAKFIGTEEQAKNPITGTLKDAADNPELYNLNKERLGLFAKMEERNNKLLDYVVAGYNAEIGQFKPKEGGAFLPNVDISEDVIEYLGSETRAAATGRGKTRIWQTARERMEHDKTFKPETDVQKLLEGLDSFKSSAAGGQSYRQVIGGLTRLEAMKETHPKLYDWMIGLRTKLQKLQGYRNVLKEEQADVIDSFLNSGYEDTDIAGLRDALEVKLEPGQYVAKAQAGKTLADIQAEIDDVRAEMTKIRPAWNVANLKPYVFVQEGVFRYFPSDQSAIIKESRQRSNSMLVKFAERWRGQAFSGDLSPFAIQGVIGVLADPYGSLKAGLGATRTAVQQKDFLRSIKLDALADDVTNDPVAWAEYASLAGRQITGTPSEYAAGFLSLIPGMNKFTESTYITVTRGSFNLWQRTYKSMIKHGMPELEAKVAAMNLATEVYPLVSSTRLGQSEARGAFLKALPTSYSFIRQPTKLIYQASMGFSKLITFQKLTAQESLALKTTVIGGASTLAVCATSAAISAAARGDDEDKIKKAMRDAINPDPLNGKFCSVIIGNKRIPFGGPYRALFRAMFPQEVPGIPFPVPFYGLLHYNTKTQSPEGFLWNRITPAIKTQIELLLNKDWSDNQILKGGFFEVIARGLAYEFENFLPLTAGTAVEALRQGKKYKEDLVEQVMAQFMGVNLVTMDNTYYDRKVRELGQEQPTEPRPYTVPKPDYYNLKDLWGDGRYIKNETSKELEKREYDKVIVEMAKTREMSKPYYELPQINIKDINTKSVDKDGKPVDTIVDFKNQYELYEQVVKSGVYNRLEEGKYKDYKGQEAIDLLKKDYPNYNKGNLTNREYAAAIAYSEAKNKEQWRRDNLESYDLINKKPSDEWLKSNPEINARLAMYGQADIQSYEAFDAMSKLVKEWDIVDNALPDQKPLPPRDLWKDIIKYQDLVKEKTVGSIEAQLEIAKNDKLRAYKYPTMSVQEVSELKSKMPEYELRVKHTDKFDLMKGYGDKEDTKNYIADEDERAKAVKALRLTKIDGVEFRDIERRVDAMSKGTPDKPTLEDNITKHIEFMKKQDEEGIGANSPEVMLYRIDNKDYEAWREDESVWGKDKLQPIVVDEAQITIWRIKVSNYGEGKAQKTWRQLDDEWEKITDTKPSYPSKSDPNYYLGREYAHSQMNPEYLEDKDRVEVWGDSDKKPANMIVPLAITPGFVEKVVAFNKLPLSGFARKRMLAGDDKLDRYMQYFKDNDPVDPTKIPDIEWDRITEKYQDEFDLYEKPIGDDGRELTTDADRTAFRDNMFRENPKFMEAHYKRDAYSKFFPKELITDYVNWKVQGRKSVSKDEKGEYDDYWFLQEHPEFYQAMKKTQEWKPVDFRKVPSRGVYKLYQGYKEVPDYPVERRLQFRYDHPELNQWGMDAQMWTQTLADLEKKLTKLKSVVKTTTRTEYDKWKAEQEELLGAWR